MLYGATALLLLFGLACATFLAATPAPAQAVTCSSPQLHVNVLIYGLTSEPMSDYSSNPCWVGTRVFNDMTNGHHFYMICYYDQLADNQDGTHLVYNETVGDLTQRSLISQMDAVESCANSLFPPATSIKIEYMYPKSKTPQCTGPCWQVVTGINFLQQGITETSYPELYWGTAFPESEVEPLLSTWISHTYSIWPSNSSGTMAETPFLNSSHYEDWSALRTDVYNLCQATASGNLGIYVGSNKTQAWNNGGTTPNAEQQTALALNNCFS